MSFKNCKIHLLQYGPMPYQSEFIHFKSPPSTSEVCHTLGFNFFFFCGMKKIPGHTANISVKWVHVQRTTETKVCALLSGRQAFHIGNLGWAAHPSTAQITKTNPSTSVWCTVMEGYKTLEKIKLPLSTPKLWHTLLRKALSSPWSTTGEFAQSSQLLGLGERQSHTCKPSGRALDLWDNTTRDGAINSI